MNEKKAVLITGCQGGVGSALCQAFKFEGFLVFGVDRIGDGQSNCDLFIQVDLSEFVQTPSLREHVRQRVIGDLLAFDARLVGLINNAAVQVIGDIDTIDVDEFEFSHRINVTAPFVLAKLFSEELRAAQGAIVNIGSIHSRLTKPGFCAYSVSKAGLAALTRALSLDFGGEVTVNTISPAAVDTSMLRAGFDGDEQKMAKLAQHHPVGRIGRPLEVARIAVFLTSDDARFISGTEIFADGAIGVRLHDPV